MEKTYLTKEELTACHKDDLVSGLILCKDFNVAKTKTGNSYIQGTLQNQVEIPFKAWNNSAAFPVFTNANSCRGMVLNIKGTVDDYGGTISIILSEAVVVPDESVDAFLPVIYDVEAYWNGLKQLVYANVSEKGKQLADNVLFENETVSERFKNEFAAKTYHDNVKSGLLVHTYKLLYLLINALPLYTNLLRNTDEKDILILGALFHDIGKIREMQFGVYQPESKVTHRYLGIELLNKDLIIQLYGESAWYDFVSILLQHHGEFEDKCRTTYAFIIHKIDCLDADLTYLMTERDKQQQGLLDIIRIGEYRLV